jgi:hypothetical protein
MSAEYAKENKQHKLTAKNFKANMIEEQAESTEELIAVLTEKHTQQIELLIPFVIGIICSRGIPVFLDSQTKIIAASLQEENLMRSAIKIDQVWRNDESRCTPGWMGCSRSERMG